MTEGNRIQTTVDDDSMVTVLAGDFDFGRFDSGGEEFIDFSRLLKTCDANLRR